MNKNEPLKNKPLKDKAFELDPDAKGEEGSAFWFTDVKSAVQGLLEEIDELIEEYRKEVCNEVTKHNLICTLSTVKNLIKKWFPDVVGKRR